MAELSLESLLSNLDLIAGFIIPAVFTFLILYYYWDLDKQTESFDKDCREDIKENPSFRGIRESADIVLVSTSNSRISTATTALKKVTGLVSEKPIKIIPVEGRSIEERHKEVIRERAREIPGKNIIQTELVAAIRSYYAYRLALSTLGSDSNVTHDFRAEFEDYEYSGRVSHLADRENYESISLADDRGAASIPLDDVFLRVLKGVDEHCIRPITDIEKQNREIERCREFMMEFFWGLYAHVTKGLELRSNLDEDVCESKYRTDVRDEDNIGYWLLPPNGCSDTEFERFLHAGWRVRQVLNEYWDEDNYSQLHPPCDRIPEMHHVNNPFILFSKDLEQFDGGPKWMRIKEDPRYRKKEGYAS